MKFRTLKASEIECRIGNANKAKTGFSLLLYKDARCDMNILDETVGFDGWKRDHKELKGVIYCGVSIWSEDRGEWITKWDAGTESNTEKQKGEASDSFKRACFNFGLGRELYTAPFIWIKTSNYESDKYNKYIVDYISYKDGVIDGLSISCKNKEVYRFGKITYDKPAHKSIEEIGELVDNCKSLSDLISLKADYETEMNSINLKDRVIAKYNELNNGF